MATGSQNHGSQEQVRVVVRSGTHRIDSDLRATIKKRVNTAFRRFVKRIRTVRVWLEDVNGPRGGIDCLCRIEVQLIPADATTVESRASTLRAALTVALERAKRTIDRLLKRRRTKARDGRRSANRRDD